MGAPVNLTVNSDVLFVVDLVGLLRWKAKKREIPSVLTSLLKIRGEEIVKVIKLCAISHRGFWVLGKRKCQVIDNRLIFLLQFLQDIFDALFAILNESADQYGNLVFRAVVRSNFKPIYMCWYSVKLFVCPGARLAKLSVVMMCLKYCWNTKACCQETIPWFQVSFKELSEHSGKSLKQGKKKIKVTWCNGKTSHSVESKN